MIEGDIASTIDAEKIARSGAKVVQINTGGSCHLIAQTVLEALKELAASRGALVFVENIGNLVCPAAFDLGERLRILVSSVAEGDDKPYKYPDMFLRASAVVLTKIDVSEAIGFNRAIYYQGLKALDEETPVYETSFRSGQGEAELAGWLKKKSCSIPCVEYVLSAGV